MAKYTGILCRQQHKNLAVIGEHRGTNNIIVGFFYFFLNCYHTVIT